MKKIEASNTSSKHYDENYFNWQKGKGGGGFGGWAEPKKFQEFIKKTDVVIDFGCGGGFLLNGLFCKEKIGIEPNQSAGESCINLGINLFSSPAEAIQHLGHEYADVIISNHALEHTYNPLQELLNLKMLLKRGGEIIFCVPCEGIGCGYKAGNIDQHLYTWSPLNLGNLFNEAGFQVEHSKPLLHKWPPFYRSLAKLGWPIFNSLCLIYGYINRSTSQVIIKAIKP